MHVAEQGANVDLVRALAVLAEAPEPGHAAVAAAVGLTGPPDSDVYASLFVFQLYPYASVYLGAEGMLGGEARDRIAGFWRAVGRIPPAEPDHLSALLGLYAGLLDEAARAESEARRALVANAGAALLREHLAPWVPWYLERVRAHAGAFYARWAELLARLLADELSAAGRDDDPLPVHLREAPELEDPRQGGATDFLSGLLAPARTGVILTRSDLARIGRERGLGLRVGERRYVLRHLLAQDAPGTLGALAAQAEQAAADHVGREHFLGTVSDFWARRAERTGRLLRALQEAGADALRDAEEPTG